MHKVDMKTYAFSAVLAIALLLWAGGVAGAATATRGDLVDAVQKFVQTGLANADSSFTALRGDAFTQPPGTHYHVNTAFGQFFPACHVSGYIPPQASVERWVLSCSSVNMDVGSRPALRSIVYEGVVRALPACFTRTLNATVLGDEDFRWDCHMPGRAVSVDVSSRPEKTTGLQFLLEVYNYVAPQSTQSTPAPAPSPPSVVHVVPKQPTVEMAGVQVPYDDYVLLNVQLFGTLTGKNLKVMPMTLVSMKGGNEMPPYDWAWHYAGKSKLGGTTLLTVWVCGNLSPDEQSIGMKQAALMGLLDAGLGGKVLQLAYIAARDADLALGTNSPDPFANRRKFIAQLYPFFR